MYLDGEEQFQSVCLDFFVFFMEMNTLDSPKFSARFEQLGGSRLGHSLLPSKTHQCLVKADYR